MQVNDFVRFIGSVGGQRRSERRGMQRVLVATDFSTRSDRALRRGGLLARQVSAELTLVHVVDDDQPRPLIEAEQHEATALLHELCRTVREIDGIACESRVVLGDAFQGLTTTADETGADLLIIGPHRRQVLRDTFFGTTAERTIRTSRKPVLMANAVPASPYRTILLATDFSEASVIAAQAAKQLQLLGSAKVIALHVLDVPEAGPIFRASMTVTEFENFMARAEKRAAGELEVFMRDGGIGAPNHQTGRGVHGNGDKQLCQNRESRPNRGRNPWHASRPAPNVSRNPWPPKSAASSRTHNRPPRADPTEPIDRRMGQIIRRHIA